MTKTLTPAVRRLCRRAAGATWSAIPVSVVPGDSPPTVQGSGWCYRTRGGAWIQYPGAYSRKGASNMVYCSSTYRVEVGEEWIASQPS